MIGKIRAIVYYTLLVITAFALGFVIASRVMIAYYGGVFNISYVLQVEAAICILSIIVILLLCKNRINEDSVQSIVMTFGLVMVVAFIGIMFSDNISGVLQKWFGVNESANPKNAVLEFIGLGIGGIIAVYGLIAFSRRAAAQEKANKLTEGRNIQDQLDTEAEQSAKERTHVQDQLKAAVEHLSNTKSVSGRIASFYEFYYLAKNAKGNKDDSTQTSAQTILDILCAHLRIIASTEEGVTDDKDSKRQKEEVNSLIGLLFGKETGTVFKGLKFNFQHVKVNLDDVDFSSINLTNANFNFSHLIKADFQDVVLLRSRFKEASLRWANFQRADLRRANLWRADLWRADLQGANLRNAYLIDTKLQWAKLQWTKWQNAYLMLADLRNANFKNAYLREADLRWANLRGADFKNADLHKADLRGADLRETSFYEKDLYETKYLEEKPQRTDFLWANFRETKNLKTAELSGAKYSEETKFPDDFDPKDYGMKLCPPYNENKGEE